MIKNGTRNRALGMGELRLWLRYSVFLGSVKMSEGTKAYTDSAAGDTNQMPNSKRELGSFNEKLLKWRLDGPNRTL